MRSLLALLAAVVFLLVGIPLLGIEWVIGKINPHARDISSLRLVQGVFKVMLFFSGVKLTVIGEENVPKDQAVLYVLNHRSYYDVFIVYSRVPGLTGFIAKKEIGKLPLVPLWMKRLYCLLLDRSDIKQGMRTVLTAIDYCKKGISIAVCPEGTRGKAENETEMLPFHDGTFKIASKSGVPVVPITLNNTSAILEDHMPWVRRTHVVVEYGKPVLISSLDKEEQKHPGEYFHALMTETLCRNQKLLNG